MFLSGAPASPEPELQSSLATPKTGGLFAGQNVWSGLRDPFHPFALKLARCPHLLAVTPHSFTFYVAPPGRSILTSYFEARYAEKHLMAGD
jgi:hypothetical protein